MNDLNFDGLTDAQLRLFAVRCARRVQHLMTDPRSLAALDVAERHTRGEATDAELWAAYSASSAAAWAAAWAASDAAWAAWAAAWTVAWDAAYAASSAARAAASSAAAKSVEREAQQKILDEIRQEQSR